MAYYLDFDKKKYNLSIKYSFFIIYKKIETLIFVFLCIIFLLTSKIHEEYSKKVSYFFVNISAPISQIIAFPINTVIILFNNFNDLIFAKKENKALKEELEKLKFYYINSLNIHQENKELRNALNFVKSRSTNYKSARLIGIANQNFGNKIYIDAGKNRNIKEGSIVIGNFGVIGRIQQVDEDISKIILITDSLSHIPIIASKARVRGILVGNNSEYMEINYLNKNNRIEIGDQIFTSGDGDTLPPGLLVGVVKKINKNSVFVVPVENINKVNIATIIEF
jgi:rod shape-determining protein MreC